MNLKHIFAFSLLMLGVVTVHAQLTIDGEFRTKMNIDKGQKYSALSDDNTTLFFDQRSRVRLNYATEKYTTRFTLQDTRIWGGDDLYNKTGPLSNSESLGVYEAWVELNLSEMSALRVGRQEWHYDDIRLLANRNWWTSGLSYDGILYKYNNKEAGITFDAGFSYNNNGVVNGFIDNSNWQIDKLKSMNFINLKKQFSKYTSLTWVSTLTAKQDTANMANVATGTHGVYFTHNKNKKVNKDGFFADAGAYFQHGKDINRGTDGEYKSISAYMITAELGTRTMNKKLELSAGVEHLSGRDYSNTDADYINTRHSFDLQTGGRLPFYGGFLNQFIIQDSYLVGSKGGAFTNPYLKAVYKPNSKSYWETKIHFPMLTSKVTAHTGINPATSKPMGKDVDSNGNTVYWEGSLGNYIDVTHIYKFSKEVMFRNGVSFGLISDTKNQMVNGYEDATQKTLYNAGPNYFVYSMLIIKPTFFKSDK